MPEPTEFDLTNRLQATLGDQYTVERELGGGGMSRVFVVAERDPARRLVVKVLPPDVSAAVDIERFRREVQLVAGLQHPHIIPLVSSGARDGLLFYTMPFISGESLRTRLDRDGPLPVPDVVRVLRDVVDALAAAHERGVVHRDVKPDNVLVSGRHAVVADFGVARALSTANEASGVTASGVILGTAPYMAPEQVSADPNIDHRADIYAVGAMAYELLAGRPPFVGASAHEIMAAHVTLAPEPVTQHRKDVPAGLANLVMRCLAKKPADRWPSADELLEELEHLTSSSAGSRKPWMTWKWPITAAAAVVAIAGALLANRMVGARGGKHIVAVILRAGAASADIADILPDQISERLTRALIDAAPPGLAVISPSSAEQFRGQAARLDSIRSQLKADHIVSLKVDRAGPVTTVSADLVNTATGASRKIWTYDVRADTAALALPTRIASNVIDEMGLRPAARASRRHEPTPEAEDAYQRGLIVARRIEGKADLDLAMTYFQKAMVADPLYPDPYAMAAWVHQNVSGLDGVPPTYAYAIADSFARRAIELDDNSADGHAVFGFTEAVTAWRWEVAEREVLRALALNPNSPLAHVYYSFLLGIRGELVRALDEIDAAIRVDPQSTFNYVVRILWQLSLGQPDSAIAMFHKAQALQPGFLYDGFFVADGFRQRGMIDSALALDSAASAQYQYATPGLVMSLVAANRREEATRAFQELEDQARAGRFQMPEEVGRAAEVLGDREAALRWVSLAKSAHSDVILLHRHLPEMQKLRQDPRYQAMMREMRLPN